MCIWPFNAVPILFLEIIKWQHVACSSVPAQADCLDGSSKTYSIRSLRNNQLQLLIYIWTDPITEDNSFSCFFFSLWLGLAPSESLSCGYCSGTLQLNRWTLPYIIHLGIIWQNNPVKYFSDWESCIAKRTGEDDSKNVNFCYLGSGVGNTMCNTADEPSNVAVLEKFIHTLSNVIQ